MILPQHIQLQLRSLEILAGIIPQLHKSNGTTPDMNSYLVRKKTKQQQHQTVVFVHEQPALSSGS